MTLQGPTSELSLGYLDVYLTFAVDLTALFTQEQWEGGWRSVLARRVGGPQDLDISEIEGVARQSCMSGRVADEVARRMEDASRRNGKQIWTDLYLRTEAPLECRIDQHVSIDGARCQINRRISDTAGDLFHNARFSGNQMRLYREGVFTFTIQFQLVPDRVLNGGTERPLAVSRAIELIEELDRVGALVFHSQLQAWLRGDEAQAAIRRLMGLEFNIEFRLTSDELKRRSKTHRLLFLETLFRFSASNSGASRFVDQVQVSPSEALDNVALAGLLNTSSWYEKYRPSYLSRVAEKDLGYRADEIYVTDRKSTLVSNPAFWDSRDNLRIYREDLILVAEYWATRLVEAHALLNYLQLHPDIVGLEESEPADGLRTLVDANNAFARLKESLDPSRIIDHGFTVRLMQRLRAEMGIDIPLEFIEERLKSASESMSLRSAVAAEGATVGPVLALQRQGHWLTWGAVAVATISLAVALIK